MLAAGIALSPRPIWPCAPSVCIYPVGSSGVIEDGVVLIENGRIDLRRRPGLATSKIPASGVEVLEARGRSLPGLVDVHSVVGLAGIYNSDQRPVCRTRISSRSRSPVQPELRAVDAYDAVEPLVEWARSLRRDHRAHGARPGRG